MVARETGRKKKMSASFTTFHEVPEQVEMPRLNELFWKPRLPEVE